MNLERHCNYVSILSSRLLGKPTQYYKKTSGCFLKAFVDTAENDCDLDTI